MIDTENMVQEEVATQEIQEQPDAQTVAETSVAPQPQQESPAERNYRVLVEKSKRAERERDEAIRLLKEKEVSLRQEEPEEEISIGNDEIAEGKHVRAINKKLQKMEEKLKQYEQKSTTMSEEALLKAQYPDIDKVVSKENLAALREADPEFAEMLDTSTSFRAKVVSAYKQIKKAGIYIEDTFQSERDMAQKNAAKPKPLASVSPQQGDSPLSRANAFAEGLTPELKNQLLREMEEARKNR